MRKQVGLATCCAFLLAAAGAAAEEDAPSGSCGSIETPAAEPAPSYSPPDYSTDQEGATAKEAENKAIDTWTKYQQEVRAALLASRSPRDWALSTLVGMPFDAAGHDRTEANAADRELLSKAATNAPEDAVVQWIRLWRERGFDHPDVPVRAALRDIEPDNAALLMDDLNDAAKAKDETGVDFILSRMAHGQTFDNHYALVNGALVDAIKRFPAPTDAPAVSGLAPAESGDAIAETMAMAFASMYAFPAYQRLVDACRFDAGSGDGASRRNDCGAIGRLMARNGTDLISVRIGEVVLRVSQMYTDEDVKFSRDIDWINDQFSSVMRGWDEHDTQGLRHFQRWAQEANELEAMRATIVAAGRPASPPLDWQDTSLRFTEKALEQDKVRYQELHPKSQ